MGAETFWFLVRALVYGALLGVPVGYLIAYALRLL